MIFPSNDRKLFGIVRISTFNEINNRERERRISLIIIDKEVGLGTLPIILYYIPTPRRRNHQEETTRENILEAILGRNTRVHLYNKNRC